MQFYSRQPSTTLLLELHTVLMELCRWEHTDFKVLKHAKGTGIQICHGGQEQAACCYCS